MQITLNAPFEVLWMKDRTNPSIQAFDMSVLVALHTERLALLPISGTGS